MLKFGQICPNLVISGQKKREGYGQICKIIALSGHGKTGGKNPDGCRRQSHEPVVGAANVNSPYSGLASLAGFSLAFFTGRLPTTTRKSIVSPLRIAEMA